MRWSVLDIGVMWVYESITVFFVCFSPFFLAFVFSTPFHPITVFIYPSELDQPRKLYTETFIILKSLSGSSHVKWRYGYILLI